MYREDWRDALMALIAAVVRVGVTITLVLLTGLWRYVAAAFGRHGFHPLLIAFAGITFVSLSLATFFALSSARTQTAWGIGIGVADGLGFVIVDGALTLQRVRRGEDLQGEDLSDSLRRPWWS